MNDTLARCLKQIAIQVCTKLWSCSCAWRKNCHELFPVYHSCLIMIVHVHTSRFTILIDVYFLQVKNKPWLPWVYSWIRHRREHYPSSKGVFFSQQNVMVFFSIFSSFSFIFVFIFLLSFSLVTVMWKRHSPPPPYITIPIFLADSLSHEHRPSPS